MPVVGRAMPVVGRAPDRLRAGAVPSWAMSALSLSHRVAGGLALAAGALTAVGGACPLLKVRSTSALGELFGDPPAPAPSVPAAHWAAIAGVVLALAGAGLLLASSVARPIGAERLRPAVSVLWAAPVPAVFSALRTASTAVQASATRDPFLRLAAPELGFGGGVWLFVAAVALALAAGFACLVAGIFDREAWDEARELAASAGAWRGRKGKARKGGGPVAVEADPREGRLDRRVLALAATAGGFGALGALLPLYVGPGFRSTWLPDVPFSSQAFGQFLLASVVASAAAVGLLARASRRPALWAGAALALVAYVAGYPFLSAGRPGSIPGPGLWAALAGAAAFAVAAGAPTRLSERSLGFFRRDQRDQRKT